jgi:hypothetical protein
MNVVQSAGDLTLAYEALRGQATGELPSSTPRGLALFVAAGCPSWMYAWQPLVTAPRHPVVANLVDPPAGKHAEVVRVLTEMALGCQKRWTA